MAHNLAKTAGSKRVYPGASTGTAPQSVTCFFTRETLAEEWCVWNTSVTALKLHKGDRVPAHLVHADLKRTTPCRAHILKDFTVCGMNNYTCVLEGDIRFEESGIGDTRLVAETGELANVCKSKGLVCALFLQQYMSNSADEDLELGERMHSLYIDTVREMISRKYDIMHHYPLFNRVITMHYSNKDNSEPPTTNDVIIAGGLLDQSVANHEFLHGIKVTRGGRCIPCTHWNYPGDTDREAYVRRGNDVGSERAGVGDPGESSVAANRCSATGEVSRCRDFDSDSDCVENECQARPNPTTSSLSTEESTKTYTAVTMQSFNSHPGTLTDRLAFPYSFAVHTGQRVTFNHLVDYCVSRTAEPVCALPSRKEWGAVNPVLLMEDNVDPATRKPVHTYTIASRGYLSTLRDTPGGVTPCYNEVFLPNRPVSRLNLDVDLKCCKRCAVRFAAEARFDTKRKVAKALAVSLVLVIAESLLGLKNLTRADMGHAYALRDFTKNIGKIAVYIRASPVKSKLSLRMLWYLPLELCSVHGIEAYRPLLEEMERISIKYVLLSYPSGSDSCGLCDLGTSMAETSRSSSRCLMLDSTHSAERRSAIDKAPYSFKKCVRLPNCYKEGARFEYIDTFNNLQDFDDDSGFDDPSSLSVGLSSNPIAHDVTSLGNMFLGVLSDRTARPQSTVEFKIDEAPCQSRVKDETERLTSLWGVPVTVKMTGSGLVCIQATAKSTYPCPIHNRVHGNTKLSALVFATHVTPKCFVP